MAITEQEEIEIEKNIWNLIHLLYTDEQNVRNNEDENFMDKNVENAEGVNEVLLVENLERKNPLIRRIRIIIQWLEKIASESNNMKVIREKMSAFPEKCFNWEHTLHQISKKSTIQMSGRDYVTELVF
jgi:hypothetical protein